MADHFNKAGVARLEAHRRKERRATARLFLLVAVTTTAIGIAATNMPARVTAHFAPQPRSAELGIGCVSPAVTDGDTLRCGDRRIRLSAIDAPELPGHCARGRQCTPGDPFASKANLERLTAGHSVACAQLGTDRYGRAIASCSVAGRNLECDQVAGGYAVERYGRLSC
jgi:endonuclease YncB( thermonuclease family)